MSRLSVNRRIASPNFGLRAEGARITLIVLHYTAVPRDEALALLCDPGKEVSAHYLIDQSGKIFGLVDEDKRAWHAGKGSWRGITDVNSHSIGIEIENGGAEPFAEPAMVALEALLVRLLKRYRLGPEAMIGHSDLAPTRKTDPGRHFDWQRLARQGLSVWPETVPHGIPPDPSGFLRAAQQFGYGIEAGLEPILRAFRLRFRHGATGLLDQTDMGIVAALTGPT